MGRPLSSFRERDRKNPGGELGLGEYGPPLRRPATGLAPMRPPHGINRRRDIADMVDADPRALPPDSDALALRRFCDWSTFILRNGSRMPWVENSSSPAT